MSETGFMLFQYGMTAVQICIYAILLAVFFTPFMSEKKEKKGVRIKKGFFLFLIVAVPYWMKEVTPFDGWSCMVVVIVLLTAVSGYIGMERKFAFYLGVLFFCIRNLCILSLQSINSFTSEYFVKEEYPIEKNLRNAAYNSVLVELLQILIFCVLLYIVYIQLKKGRTELHRRELFYLLLTPVTGILFVNIIVRILIIATGDLVLSLYEQVPVLLGIVPMAACLFYAAIVAAIRSYQEMHALQEERKKYFVEEQQVRLIQERMEEVEQFYDGIRRMKHEMRNHLTNIQGLAASGKYEDMEQYIVKMDEGMEIFELTMQTGNPVTDVIINDKGKSAEKQGIHFQSEFRYPASDQYNAYDVGIIVHNLLQNALEACEKVEKEEKYIYLSGTQKKKFFLIQVINSYKGKIIFDEGTKLPKSTKEKEISLHGFGLSNVKREVEKYRGNMEIKIRENEFCVTVMLQEGRKNE